MKFKTLLSVSALSIATFIGSAQAAIIPAMDFATKSGWLADGLNSTTVVPSTGVVSDCAAGVSNATNSCGLTFSGSSGIAGAYTDVTWGASGKFSGLNVLSQSGTLVTNGGWVQTGLITHTNKPIPNTARTLQDLDLATYFSLINPALFSDVGAKVGIKFTETKNETNLKNCPNPQLSGVGCDDTFLVNLNLPAIKFVIDGNLYTIKFKLNPLSGVTQSVINPDGSVVLVTKEDDINQLELLARLEVPAPATVGLLGLSLLLVSSSVRRRK